MIKTFKYSFSSGLSSESRRVVITGISGVTALGMNINEVWANLMENKSGIKRNHENLEIVSAKMPAEVFSDEFHDENKMRMDDKFFTFAHFLTHQAFEDSGMMQNRRWSKGHEAPERMGVMTAAYSYYIDRQTEFKGLKRSKLLSGYPFALHGALCLEHGLLGYQANVANGAIGGLKSIGDAYRLIKHGYQDVLLTGGLDRNVNSAVESIYLSQNVLTTNVLDPAQSVRPFDRNSSGTAMGDGGSLLVIESLEHAKARKARILCEIVGYDERAFPADFYTPSSLGITKVLAYTMKEAGWGPEDIQYMNLSGCGMLKADKIEAESVVRVLGTPKEELHQGKVRDADHIEHKYLRGPIINGFKGYIGHCLEASGSIETSLVIKSMVEGTIVGTKNLAHPEVGELNFAREGDHQKSHVERAVKLCTGFGNSVNAIALKRDPHGDY